MKKSIFILGLLLILTNASFAGNNKTAVIQGKVIDNQGEPIAGATVYLEESNTTVYTDFDGEFIVKTPAKEVNTITVTMVSYTKKKSIVSLNQSKNEPISIKLYSK